MKLTRRKPDGTDEPTIIDALNALPRVGCDDPEHEQWRARAETAEAERDNEYAAACELGARLAQVEAERDAAQAQLARHLARSIPLGDWTEWTEVAPAPAEQPLPRPVNGTWEPPPLTDWDEWERHYDAIRDGEVPEGARGTGVDWPDVPGDRAEGVPERIEVTE